MEMQASDIFLSPKPKYVPFRFSMPPPPSMGALAHMDKSEATLLLHHNNQRFGLDQTREELVQQVHSLLAGRGNREDPREGPPRRMPPCAVCLVEETAFIFSLCGHLGVCAACKEGLFNIRVFSDSSPAWELQFAVCPICRRRHASFQIKPVFLA